MTSFRIVEYILIAAAGLILGIAVTLFFMSENVPAASPAEVHDHEVDHDHGRAEEVLAVDDWCVEHRVPESVCTLCSPELAAKFKQSGDWCGEHGIPESHCRRCNPRLRFANEPIEEVEPTLPAPEVFFTSNDANCSTADAVIRFASAETAERSGIAVAPALTAVASGREVDAPAELIFDETRTYAVTTSLPATVIRWRAELGQQLRAGDPIADLEAPEMAALQAEYLEALAETRFDSQESARADSLHGASLISSAEHQRIVNEYVITKTRRNGLAGQLRAAGLSDEQITNLESTGVGSRWTLTASQNGNLLDRRAPLGLMQEAGATIGLLGEPKALWIEGHLRQSDASMVRVGQRAYFAADGGSLERIPAEIFWVAPFVDSDSRTVSVRARLLDFSSSVKAYRFGRLIVDGAGESGSVLVAKDAVHWEGCCNIVFVREDAARYRPRKVEIDRGNRSHYRVAAGLSAGELVVVKGGYLLKTELMKSSLGAGCAGH